MSLTWTYGTKICSYPADKFRIVYQGLQAVKLALTLISSDYKKYMTETCYLKN